MMHSRNDRAFLMTLGTFATWIGIAYVAAKWFRQHSFVNIIYFALPLAAAVIVWFIPKIGSGGALKAFFKAWFNTLWAYALLVSASAILLLLGSSAVGYLPYSDRPGPGWGHIPLHLPGLDEIKYFSEWAVLLLPMCYFLGSLLFIFMAWIRWLSAPTWLARILGGLFCAGCSMLTVAAAGWYIAISVFVSDGVGGCGLLFGLIVLPRFSPEREMQLSLGSRMIGITLGFMGITAVLIYPFIRSG